MFDFIASILSSAQLYSVLLTERAVTGLLRLCLLICDQVSEVYVRQAPKLNFIVIAQPPGSAVHRLGCSSKSTGDGSECRVGAADVRHCKDIGKGKNSGQVNIVLLV